jgi:hypothetical protein
LCWNRVIYCLLLIGQFYLKLKHKREYMVCSFIC